MRRVTGLLVVMSGVLSGCSSLVGDASTTTTMPLRHTVTVEYDVGNNLWSNLPDGECEHRATGMEEGQSVTLAGPDGVLLGSAFVSNGTVVDAVLYDESDAYDGEVCRFEFTFVDIPEVAVYLFGSRNGDNAPPISLGELRRQSWHMTIFYGY